MSDEQRVNALIVAEQGFILTASQNGFGKLTPLEDFPKHGRGGQGVIALQITDRNGRMVGALQVSVDDEIMLMSQNGVLVRTPVKDISVVGRNTQGRAPDPARGGRSALRARAHRRPGGRGRGGGCTRLPATSRRPTRRRPDAPADGPAVRRPLSIPAMRAFNFSPGPAVLPLEVLEQARDELLDWHQSGMSVMEISHRSKAFEQVAAEAEADLRELLSIPRNYKVLFLQGGASAQFSFVPMNLAAPQSTVDYVNTGHWSQQGDHRGGALLHGARGRRCRRQLHAGSAAERVALQRGRRVCALHAE